MANVPKIDFNCFDRDLVRLTEIHLNGYSLKAVNKKLKLKIQSAKFIFHFTRQVIRRLI